MGDSNITKPNSSLLEKGMDTINDSKASKGSKAAALAAIAIGAVAYLGVKAMDVLKEDKQ